MKTFISASDHYGTLEYSVAGEAVECWAILNDYNELVTVGETEEDAWLNANSWHRSNPRVRAERVLIIGSDFTVEDSPRYDW